MLKLSFFLGGVSLLIVSCAWAKGPSLEEQERIAYAFAPVIYQDYGTDWESDLLTRFDFDGDLDGSNNWEHTRKFPKPSYVYYSYQQTETQIFLLYQIFHPRDYEWLCMPWICHENDLEGLLVVLDSQTHNVLLLETLYHDRVAAYANTDRVSGKAVRLRNPAERRLRLENNQRVRVYSEAGGHGIYEKQEWMKNLEFTPGMGIVYHAGSTADVVTAKNVSNASYRLLRSDQEFFERVLKWAQMGPGHKLSSMFDRPGTVAVRTDRRLKNPWLASFPILPLSFWGKAYGQSRANFPWRWDFKNDGNVGTGQWAMDPAYAIKEHLTIEGPWSLEYVVSPY